MKKALLTFGSGEFLPMLEIALPPMARYANKHGYDLIVGDGQNDEGRPPSWSKIPMLQRWLREYDLCLWIDCDCYVVEDGIDVAEGFPEDKHQAVVCHFAEHCGHVPSTGLWLVRPEALPFLGLAWGLELFWDHPFREQAAAMVLWGYGGVECGYGKQVRDTKHHRKLHYLPKCWNSHPLDPDPGPRIVHCPNPWSFEERMAMMKKLAAGAR